MREKIIKLSDKAVDRIKEIMSLAKNSTIGVRVGVKSGGCAGMSYVMEYAKEVKPNEEVIEDKGVKVLIDPKAIMYLLGTEMDYKKDKFSSQFIIETLRNREMWMWRVF
jgi:Iron-sulfur cluster assembly accessory protein